jgi:hypothetical protein
MRGEHQPFPDGKEGMEKEEEEEEKDNDNEGSGKWEVRGLAC